VEQKTEPFAQGVSNVIGDVNQDWTHKDKDLHQGWGPRGLSSNSRTNFGGLGLGLKVAWHGLA